MKIATIITSKQHMEERIERAISMNVFIAKLTNWKQDQKVS